MELWHPAEKSLPGDAVIEISPPAWNKSREPRTNVVGIGQHIRNFRKFFDRLLKNSRIQIMLDRRVGEPGGRGSLLHFSDFTKFIFFSEF